jgi:hypothetical protein
MCNILSSIIHWVIPSIIEGMTTEMGQHFLAWIRQFVSLFYSFLSDLKREIIKNNENAVIMNNKNLLLHLDCTKCLSQWEVNLIIKNIAPFSFAETTYNRRKFSTFFIELITFF